MHEAETQGRHEDPFSQLSDLFALAVAQEYIQTTQEFWVTELKICYSVYFHIPIGLLAVFFRKFFC